MRTHKSLASAVLIASLLTGGAAEAEDPAEAGSSPGDIDARVDRGWQFEVGVYGFLPDLGATTVSGDQLDLPLWKILQNLNFTAMAEVKVRKDRFFVMNDTIYMNLQGTDTATANLLGSAVPVGVGVQMEALINTTGVGYDVIDTDRTRIGVFGGIRYLWLSTDISANIGPLRAEALDQEHVVDGVVGVIGQTDVTDKLYVTYYGDIGTGRSDLTWQLFGSLNYRFERFDAVLGYRYLDWQFDNVANLSEMSAHGPLIGVRYRF